MGVTGLSAFLKSAARPCLLSEFKGKRLAVDGNVWLHKGTYSCALQLCSGEKTFGHINYCRKMANLLRSHGATVVVVFDGHSLPAKNEEHERRRVLRARAMREMEAHDDHVRELEAAMEAGEAPPDGPAQLAEMRRMQEEAARRSVRVTEEMVTAVMADLRMIDGVEAHPAPARAAAPWTRHGVAPHAAPAEPA